MTTAVRDPGLPPLLLHGALHLWPLPASVLLIVVSVFAGLQRIRRKTGIVTRKQPHERSLLGGELADRSRRLRARERRLEAEAQSLASRAIQLNAQDQRLQAHSEQILARERLLHARTLQCDERERQLNQAIERFEEAQAILEAGEQAQRWRGSQLAETIIALACRERRLAAQIAAFTVKEEELAVLRQQADRDLRTAAVERQRLTRLQSQVDGRQRWIAEERRRLHLEREELVDHVRQLETSLAESEQELVNVRGRLQSQLAERELALAELNRALTSSRSKLKSTSKALGNAPDLIAALTEEAATLQATASRLQHADADAARNRELLVVWKEVAERHLRWRPATDEPKPGLYRIEELRAASGQQPGSELVFYLDQLERYAEEDGRLPASFDELIGSLLTQLSAVTS